jgi:peptide/nickel transport system permease protein
MLRLILGKLVRAVISLWVVTVVIFILSRVGGSPVTLLLPADATRADANALTQKLGLNHSLIDQYWRFFTGMLHGDFGTSIQYGTPVTTLIAQRLGNTLLLAATAIIFALLIAVPLGLLAARRPRGLWDRLARGVALTGQSLPPFVVGIVLVLVFAVHWRLLPTGNKTGAESFILPAITLCGFATAAITRVTYASVREALDAPYVLVARSKGLPEWLILCRHALKNAATAILTMTALQLVLFANGAIVVETIFNWPGIGLLTYNAAIGRDYPVIQAIVVASAAITIAVNLLVDFAYTLIDQRISHAASA